MNKIITLIIAAALAVTAVASPKPIGETLSSQTDGYILRISGSNTLGNKALPALVVDYLSIKSVENISTIPLDSHHSSMVRGTAPDGRSVNVLIEAQGSSTGFSALINGTADIAAASRPVTSDENARFAGIDLTTSAYEHIVGLDGLAIVVHPSNPVRELSIEQIGRIFSGEVTQWRQLASELDVSGDFPTGRIQVYSRDEASGTFDTFESLVLDRGYRLIDSAKRYESNDQVVQLVSSDPTAIGFASVASAANAKSVKVSDGEAGALAPEKMFVAAEDYSLTRRLFLYNLASSNIHVGEFLDYVDTNRAQRIIADTGFISQEIIKLPQSITASMPLGYLQLVGRAERLSLNFRFQGTSRRLDNKAMQDLDRLVEFMSQPENAGRELMLFGFAADQGDDDRERLLSEVRMLAVRKALRERGVSANAVVGYGDLNPVGSNSNPVSADRNNRVEIWIKER